MIQRPVVCTPDQTATQLALQVAFDVSAAFTCGPPQVVKERLPAESERAIATRCMERVLESGRGPKLAELLVLHRELCVKGGDNNLLGHSDAKFEQGERGRLRSVQAFVFSQGMLKEGCPTALVIPSLQRALARWASAPTTAETAGSLAAWVMVTTCHIHPFLDGNGRVARFLASLTLLRAGLLPILIPYRERDRYSLAISRIHHGEKAMSIQCMTEWVRATHQSTLAVAST
jgi:prophage maintenance system killer protein